METNTRILNLRILLQRYLPLVGIAGIVLFFIFLYKIYIPRIAAFGCFDDCFNYGAGYFLTQGKILYKDIFFNHAPFPAYVSAGIQTVTTPENIYELLLRHRQFVLLFGLASTIILYLRFGFAAILFSILYEITKFYIFGDRFLAEGIIVYPLVATTGIVWQQIRKLPVKKTRVFDTVVVVFSTWFIVFMREPYALAILFLFIVFAWNQVYRKNIFMLMGILTICTLLAFPLQDFWFNLITINRTIILADSIQTSPGFITQFVQIFFYPLLVWMQGSWNLFRVGLLLVTGLLGISLCIEHKQKPARKVFTFAFILLGLLNLRPVSVGQLFYSSFHLLPWYATIVFLMTLQIQNLFTLRKKIGSILLIIFGLGIGYIYTSPQIFFREKSNPQEELVTQYSQEIQYSYTIENLSLPQDSVFLDGWAELIHWKIKRVTPYQYTWYTSVMPLVPVYRNARIDMFAHSPPDFYFGSCPKEVNETKLLPKQFRHEYINVPMQGKPSCLWIHAKKLPEITENQWQKAKELLFDQPSIVQ